MSDHIREAAEALTNLNTFASIVSILEGHIYGGSNSAMNTASKIIKLCHDEQQRQLRHYDRAKARAEETTHDRI